MMSKALRPTCLAMGLALCGCTSLQVTVPAKGSTVHLPVAIQITEKDGLDGPLTSGPKILVDGVDGSHFSNVNYSIASGSVLCCLALGSHTVSVTGSTSRANPNDISTFTVDSNVQFYTGCPSGGTVHPVVGTCCDNGACDIPGATNFGPWRFNTAACPGPSNPANDCLNQNTAAICGQTGDRCDPFQPHLTEMLAVGFSLVTGGSLRQIHLPLGVISGTATMRVIVASDAGGHPGAALESFDVPIPSRSFPVRSPLHIFSVAHPVLAANTPYWLVVGPGAANTVGSWNFASADPPSAGSANFLSNSTPDANGLPQLGGPWVPANGPLRPAFEIDVR